MSGKVNESLITKHGGYRDLKSFQIAQLVYDVTIRFCDRYIDKRSRTTDQMVQAARSGVQNIAEGSQASGTSRKFEIKLTSVARASLEELKLDYEDFLRHRGLKQWERNHPLRQALVDQRCRTADDVAEWTKEVHEQSSGQNGQPGRSGQAAATGRSSKSTASTRSTESTHLTYPELTANAARTLIAVASALLDRQISAQAESFEHEGGFSERLYRVRSQKRSKPS